MISREDGFGFAGGAKKLLCTGVTNKTVPGSTSCSVRHLILVSEITALSVPVDDSSPNLTTSSEACVSALWDICKSSASSLARRLEAAAQRRLELYKMPVFHSLSFPDTAAGDKKGALHQLPAYSSVIKRKKPLRRLWGSDAPLTVSRVFEAAIWLGSQYPLKALCLRSVAFAHVIIFCSLQFTFES